MFHRCIRSLLLVAALVQPARAEETQAHIKAPSELGRFEQVLYQAQEAKDQGRLKPERYQEFLVQFRGSLDIAWAAGARSAEDSATYARIIARLGDPAQALAVLGPALEQAPNDPNLRLTSGEVRFEQKEYPAALAEANAVLTKDPGNRRALALKHFSAGRISGASAGSPASPRSESEEGGSIWNDPRIVEASRRATGRRNAIHFMDQAMGRLKVSDPSEALRFLALAEVSDPVSADVPMQQGLAYMDLKAPGKAVDRFSQAEVIWRANGDANADLARAMKERAAAESAVRPLAERAIDALDGSANSQVHEALFKFAAGGKLSKISYGPTAPWTRALKKHSHLIGVRARIREEYRKGRGQGKTFGKEPYLLNDLSIGRNLLLLLRDMFAPALWLNMAYTTGSIQFEWTQKNVDLDRREVTVEFIAQDRLRAGSLVRIWKTDRSLLPDNPLEGQLAPLHTVELEWRWIEAISF